VHAVVVEAQPAAEEGLGPMEVAAVEGAHPHACHHPARRRRRVDPDHRPDLDERRTSLRLDSREPRQLRKLLVSMHSEFHCAGVYEGAVA